MASHSDNKKIMASTSNGRTFDPLSDLGKDYATLKAIRNRGRYPRLLKNETER